jgi:hypothetical protein
MESISRGVAVILGLISFRSHLRFEHQVFRSSVLTSAVMVQAYEDYLLP